MGSVTKEVGDTPYKGGHNDIRKTNYEVKIKEDGKLDLYTHKTVLTESTLNEAEEIGLTGLSDVDKKFALTLEKHFKGKVYQVWSGIHGKIVEIKISAGHGGYRFEQEDFQLLMKLKVRWMESTGNIISIAF